MHRKAFAVFFVLLIGCGEEQQQPAQQKQQETEVSHVPVTSRPRDHGISLEKQVEWQQEFLRQALGGITISRETVSPEDGKLTPRRIVHLGGPNYIRVEDPVGVAEVLLISDGHLDQYLSARKEGDSRKMMAAVRSAYAVAPRYLVEAGERITRKSDLPPDLQRVENVREQMLEAAGKSRRSDPNLFLDP